MIDSLQFPPVAPSPASTSAVHKSRSRGPSSGSLRKKVDYSTKESASQKFTAVVAKPQPTTPISTSGMSLTHCPGAVLVMCKAMCFTLALATLPVGSQFRRFDNIP